MSNSQVLGIRWIWHETQKEWEHMGYMTRWLDREGQLQQELLSDIERSMEVEFAKDGWWCDSNSFGLVVNSTSGQLRKVWASDAHTFTEDGLLIADDFGDEEEELEWEGFGQGWDDAVRVLEWRNQWRKVWWAEGTFTPEMAQKVTGFAMMENASTEALLMLEAARKVFGDLPVVYVTASPAHDEMLSEYEAQE